MSQYFNVPNITHSVALLLATTGVTVGLRSFSSPNAAAETFGLPRPQFSSADNAFIYAVGGRNVSSGLTIFAFAYQRNWNAIGTVMLCGVVTGLTDAIVCWRHGSRDAAIGHTVTSALFGSLGAWFVFGA